ncbi:uncharacterized protein BJX67DRAFT_379583 [Aspergillus lucknowensis]|uniref:F-box domain-containing protein n=1 Tax=Aspergillus lucknowensis TaxID=176173 RepID=A0ABR4LX44_9EURO
MDTQDSSLSRPYCIICKDSFSLDTGNLLPRIFDERPEWKASLDEHGYVKNPAELNNVYFSMPWHWKCIGRALITHPGKRYRLSGVGLAGTSIPLPRSSADCMMIGDILSADHDKPEIKDLYVADLKHRPVGRASTCHMIHERCWVLLTRVLDACLIEDNLSVFSEIVMKHYRSPSDIPSPRMKDDGEGAWNSHKDKEESEKCGLNNPRAYAQLYSTDLPCNETEHALRDPWKVVDVWEQIKAEEKKWGRERRRKPTTQSRKARRKNPLGAKLPPELIMEILDLLEDSKQIRALMWAFPYWGARVPNSYWRRRFIDEFMLEDEAQSIPGPTALNWRRLYYKTERIHLSSHGLLNRRRIVRISEKLKTSFLDALDRRN